MKEMTVHDVVVLSDVPRYLTGADDERTLYDRLVELTSEKRDIILDLTGVQHVNSNGLEVIVTTDRNVRRTGHRFVLCCVDRRIESVFVITKLSLVLDVYPTRDSALASFAPSST